MLGRVGRRLSTKAPSTAVVVDILKSRGLSETRAAKVARGLESTSKNPLEVQTLAKTLPVSALDQLEASVGDLQGDMDCELVVRVQNENGREFTVAGAEGESLQDLVIRGTDLAEYIECACGGNMTCSTCHVYVVSPHSLGTQATEEEQDMLDMAWEPIEGQSRLGCQLLLKSGKPLVVEIPKQSYNYFK